MGLAYSGKTSIGNVILWGLESSKIVPCISLHFEQPQAIAQPQARESHAASDASRSLRSSIPPAVAARHLPAGGSRVSRSVPTGLAQACSRSCAESRVGFRKHRSL